MKLPHVTKYFFCLMALASASCPGIARSAGDLPALIGRTAAVTISKPGQLALAPSGDRLAITDRFANRIFVIDSRGNLIWSVGNGINLGQPQAVLMTGQGEVTFTQWGSPRLLRVTEKNPQVIDTVVDIFSSISAKAKIMRLYQLRDKSFLVQTDSPEQLILFDSIWTQPRIIATSSTGKGKLIGTAACVELPASRLAVAGGGNYSVQLFDKTGNFITATDWNSATPQSSWTASAITIDYRERIWVADGTNSKFRLYDITGTLISVRPFSSPAVRPVDMAITSDNQLFVVNDNGRIDIYDLGLE